MANKSVIAFEVAKAVESNVSEILVTGIKLRCFNASDKEFQVKAMEFLTEARNLTTKDGKPRSTSVVGRNLEKLESLLEQANTLKAEVQAKLGDLKNEREAAKIHQNAMNDKAIADTRARLAQEAKDQEETKRRKVGEAVVKKVNERLKKIPAPVVRKPGQIKDAKAQIDLGLIEHKPDFGDLQGKTISRPVMSRPKIGFPKASAEDVDYEDEDNDSVDESKKEIYLESSERVVDYCPASAIIEFASLHGQKIGDTIYVDHLILEIGGTIDDNQWAKRVIDKGLVDRRTGIRYRVVSESGSGMRQGKLFLWPEQYAARSFEILAGKYVNEWLKKKMVPSKMVAYLGLGFSSLVYLVHGLDWAMDATIRVVSDVNIKHPNVNAVKNGRERVTIEHMETVTDGVIAVGSNIMRKIEKKIGFPEKTIHAVQIRGDLGSAIKGLMVEYTEIDPDTILVFESATKMTKDIILVSAMLQSGYLGITRINRLPDNLTGLTSLSKQVLGLLPKKSMDAVAMARDVAKWTAENIATPAAAKMLLGLLDSEDEEILLQAAMDAAKDGDMKKAALLRNPGLALQDRTVRRYVADMLVDKIRRQATFGNLLVNGFDLWQAPEPAVIKAVEQNLIGHKDKNPAFCTPDTITVPELAKIAKKVGIKLLKVEEVQWAGCPKSLKNKRVALIRHPLQHPAQFATAMMIKPTKGDHRWGIVFLPASGLYQATMGGSDFDGDEIKVVADPELIEAIEISAEGMDYLILPPNGAADKVKITKEGYDELLRSVLHRAMKAVGQIGILSNLASTASALTVDDKQRELLLSILAFLVMVAVDAVKTGVFPEKLIRKILVDEDLAGSPLKLDGDKIKVVKTKYKGREMSQKAVWLGQDFEFRDHLAHLDRTVMAEVFMDMDKLPLIVRGGQKDSNDKRVAAQLMRVARSIMTAPEDLKPVAEQIIDLLPEDAREESLNRLEQYRKDKNNSLWKQKRDEVQEYNKLISDEKRNLSAIMAEPAAHARQFMNMVGTERARALAAVVYSIRPAAAWAFCGPELVDLFGRAVDAPSLVVEHQVTAGTVKLMGIELNKISVQDAHRLVENAGKVEVKPVEIEDRGMWVHRVFVGDQCIGQVSTEFEPYAETISGRMMRVNTRKCYVEGRTLIIRFEPPVVSNGHDLWLDRALRRINDIWIFSALQGLRVALLNEWQSMDAIPKEYGLKIKVALEHQEEAIEWLEDIDDAMTIEELREVGLDIAELAKDLPEPLLEELRYFWECGRRRVTGEEEIPL